jgi:hypothetical protein
MYPGCFAHTGVGRARQPRPSSATTARIALFRHRRSSRVATLRASRSRQSLAGESASAGARVDAPVLPQGAAREPVTRGGAGTGHKGRLKKQGMCPPSRLPACNQRLTGGIEYQRLAAIRRQTNHS